MDWYSIEMQEVLTTLLAPTSAFTCILHPMDNDNPCLLTLTRHIGLLWLQVCQLTSSMRTKTMEFGSSTSCSIFWNIFITNLPLCRQRAPVIKQVTVSHSQLAVSLGNSKTVDNSRENKKGPQLIYRDRRGKQQHLPLTSENHLENRLWLLISTSCP